jgi:hypothetical protein
MATNPQDIVDAIDAAILAHAAFPISISGPAGEQMTYPNLESMMAARRYYFSLAQNTVSASKQFNLRRFVTR